MKESNLATVEEEKQNEMIKFKEHDLTIDDAYQEMGGFGRF